VARVCLRCAPVHIPPSVALPGKTAGLYRIPTYRVVYGSSQRCALAHPAILLHTVHGTVPANALGEFRLIVLDAETILIFLQTPKSELSKYSMIYPVRLAKVPSICSIISEMSRGSH
jgi:hypothetical protein